MCVYIYSFRKKNQKIFFCDSESVLRIIMQIITKFNFYVVVLFVYYHPTMILSFIFSSRINLLFAQLKLEKVMPWNWKKKIAGQKDAGAQIFLLLKPIHEAPDQINTAQLKGGGNVWIASGLNLCLWTPLPVATFSEAEPFDATSCLLLFFMEDTVKFNTCTGPAVNSSPAGAAGGKECGEAARLSCLKW